jgi:glutathione S-transferase
VAGAPGFEQLAVELGFDLVGKIISRRLGITPERLPRDLARIRAVFDEVGALVAGRRYLVGDRFSAADLTFASMAAPFLLPAEYGTRLPDRDEAPPALKELVDAFRGHPAGVHGLRMFREERGAASR